MSCATWYGGTAQLLSLTEFKSHLCKLYFIGRNDLTNERGGGGGGGLNYPEKTPDNQLKKMSCTKA